MFVGQNAPEEEAVELSSFEESESDSHASSANSQEKNAAVQDGVMQVDFSDPQRYRGTVPLRCTIETLHTTKRAVHFDKESWGTLVVALLETLIEEKNPRIPSLARIVFYRKRPFFMDKPLMQHRQYQLSNGKWIDLYCDAPSHIRIIRSVCRHCLIPLDKLVIECRAIDPEIAAVRKTPRDSSREMRPETPALPREEVGKEEIPFALEVTANTKRRNLSLRSTPMKVPAEGQQEPTAAVHHEESTREEEATAEMVHEPAATYITKEDYISGNFSAPGIGRMPPQAYATGGYNDTSRKFTSISDEQARIIAMAHQKELEEYTEKQKREESHEEIPKAIAYTESEEPIAEPVESSQTSEDAGAMHMLPVQSEGAPENDSFLVDFDHPKKCTHSRPLSCVVKGKSLYLAKQNWANLLIAFVEMLIEENHPAVAELERKAIRGKKVFFLPRKGHQQYHQLSNGKWLDLRHGVVGLLVIIERLCHHCHIPLEEVQIYYEPREKEESRRKTSNRKNTRTVPQQHFSVPPELKNMIVTLLEEEYEGGCKTDSYIELKRFRQKAEKRGWNTLPERDDLLKVCINASGIALDEKIYRIHDEIKSKLRNHIEDEKQKETDLIYYKLFFNAHRPWLQDGGIFSYELLEAVLRHIFQDSPVTFKKHYLSTEGHSKKELKGVRKEILRVWGDDFILGYKELADRLPFIPFEKITQTLATYRDFLWYTYKHYTLLSHVVMSEEEKQELRSFVKEECRRKSYVSKLELPLGAIQNNNQELPRYLLEDAAYFLALASHYERHGAIITPKGTKLNVALLVRERFSGQKSCSFQELQNYYKELTNKMRYHAILNIAYDTMIRIDADTFVHEDLIHFDVEKTDRLLDELIKGDFLPLKAMVSFGLFPECGKAWNLFLLESYCHRFSTLFRYEAPVFNSANVGIMIRKSSKLTYPEAMARALAGSHVNLEEEEALNFFYDRGYLGKRSYKMLPELLKEAHLIRNQKA
jgi:hypothetical protein